MQRGFSLIELSIVLVILGLLTGGILAGQSLIRASELRALTVELSRYQTGLQTFRDKYFAVPGDMNNATKFWLRLNTNADCVSNSGLAAAGSPGTCDGNGNGRVDLAADVNQSGEEFQAWRHLALAGLIEGNYTGLATATAYDDLVRGSNVPASRFNNGIWRLRTIGDVSGTVTGTLTSTFALNYGNVLEGGFSSEASRSLKPEEAWNADTKLDDGLPAGGSIIARGWSTCTTATARTDLSATYNLSNNNVLCMLILRNAY